MENSQYALVLTGGVLPGYATDAVWPALAAYFRMEPDTFNQQLLARAPLSIKQSDDLGKLQTLQAGAAGVGAESEICAPDGRPALFVLLDDAPRGPMPRVFVEERVLHGLWADSLSVAEVGSTTWLPFRQFNAPVPSSVVDVPPPPPLQAPALSEAPTRIAVLSPPASSSGDLADTRGEASALPPGGAIHAGFWRRCAAYIVDYFITITASYALGAVAGFGVAASLHDTASLVAAPLVGGVLGLIVGWLYFALQESSAAQATLGKRMMDIKVTDDAGRRIGFGRASGRFFGKIVSGLILSIGFMLAGWTARKQALHDMMAGTLVVFNAVQPGQPLPTVRAPMPWYGWLLNSVPFVLIAIAVLIFIAFAATIGNALGGQGSSGF